MKDKTGLNSSPDDNKLFKTNKLKLAIALLNVSVIVKSVPLGKSLCFARLFSGEADSRLLAL